MLASAFMAALAAPFEHAADVPVPADTSDPWDEQDPWSSERAAENVPGAGGEILTTSSPPTSAPGLPTSSAWSLVGEGGPNSFGLWTMPAGLPVSYGPQGASGMAPGLWMDPTTSASTSAAVAPSSAALPAQGQGAGLSAAPGVPPGWPAGGVPQLSVPAGHVSPNQGLPVPWGWPPAFMHGTGGCFPSMFPPNMVQMAVGAQIPHGQACPRPMATARPAQPTSPPTSSSSSSLHSSPPSSLGGGAPGEVPQQASEPQVPRHGASEGNGSGNFPEGNGSGNFSGGNGSGNFSGGNGSGNFSGGNGSGNFSGGNSSGNFPGGNGQQGNSTGGNGSGDLPRSGGSGRERESGTSSTTSSSAGTSEIRSLLRRRAREQERPKSSIGSVRIESFAGDRKRYLKWKKAVQAQQRLYRLDDGELAMLIYLSTVSHV